MDVWIREMEQRIRDLEQIVYILWNQHDLEPNESIKRIGSRP